MTNTAAIATKLNVLESAIVRVEEWANVMFVVVKGIGARFVSKKLKSEEKAMTNNDCMTKAYSPSQIIVTHYNTGAWVVVDTETHKINDEYRGTARQVSAELRAYAIAQSSDFKAEPRVPSPVKRVKTVQRRTVCLNCGITTTILMGRGYCTDCYGECD